MRLTDFGAAGNLRLLTQGSPAQCGIGSESQLTGLLSESLFTAKPTTAATCISSAFQETAVPLLRTTVQTTLTYCRVGSWQLSGLSVWHNAGLACISLFDWEHFGTKVSNLISSLANADSRKADIANSPQDCGSEPIVFWKTQQLNKIEGSRWLNFDFTGHTPALCGTGSGFTLTGLLVYCLSIYSHQWSAVCNNLFAHNFRLEQSFWTHCRVGSWQHLTGLSRNSKGVGSLADSPSGTSAWILLTTSWIGLLTQFYSVLGRSISNLCSLLYGLLLGETSPTHCRVGSCYLLPGQWEERSHSLLKIYIILIGAFVHWKIFHWLPWGSNSLHWLVSPRFHWLWRKISPHWQHCGTQDIHLGTISQRQPTLITLYKFFFAFGGLLLLAFLALEYFGQCFTSFRNRICNLFHWRKNWGVRQGSVRSLIHGGRSGPKSRHGATVRTWTRYLGFLYLFLLFFYNMWHWKGEGCDSAMGVTGAQFESPELTPQRAKLHGMQPQMCHGTTNWPETAPSQRTKVEKRSLKRAYRRSQHQGIAWYKGKPYSPSDFERMGCQSDLPAVTASLSPNLRKDWTRCNDLHSNKKRLNIWQWNCGGISSSRLDEVKAWLVLNHVDLAILVETRMTFDAQWSDQHWHILHSGEGPHRGKGIMVLISTRLSKAADIAWQFHESGRLTGATRPLDLVACYQHVFNRDKNRLQARQQWWETLEQVLTGIPNRQFGFGWRFQLFTSCITTSHGHINLHLARPGAHWT